MERVSSREERRRSAGNVCRQNSIRIKRSSTMAAWSLARVGVLGEVLISTSEAIR